ncbi:hypothetical protein [Streptomyces sp. NBRC 110035]|uniref:hypothetical protein n=1 Tax=Streptomyces sp. NBRC 110035 TaxID=1547867 RepID=UPI0005AA3229|nr:hypothetical protein [Streptomyces sp. NBRC 110035]
MTKFLLSLHVLAAILAVGPVTVAASMFPPAVRRAAPAGGDGPVVTAVTTVEVLHRCRVYARIGIAVPVLGLATALAMGVLGDGRLVTSIGLTAAAAAVLVAFVLPRQDELVEQLARHRSVDRQKTVRLAMFTGVFSLLWATVTVLMIVRPGSTTGA